MLKLEPEVVLDLTPEITLVPTEGGVISFDGTMTNILLEEASLDIWASVKKLGGPTLRLQHIPFTLQPGETVTADNLALTVPGWAPDGDYRYEIHVGTHPDPMANMGLGTFTFQKGDAYAEEPPGTGYMDNPNDWGDPWWPGLWKGGWHDDFEQPSTTAASIPHEFTLLAYPNPFNSASTITLSLPGHSQVRVSVYNTLGREVDLLHDAALPAGTHSFTLDARNLASGLYFVRVTVPGQSDLVQKLMLVR